MEKLKAALPHIIAVLIFITLGSIYFAPQFEGYDLNQNDVKTALGMSKEIFDFRQTKDAEPLWTNSMFGGMPAYQISMSNPNLLSTAENILFFKTFKSPLGFLLVAMVSFYILMLCFNLSPWLSIIGAVAFGFSSINILYLGGGHVTKVHAIALIPGIVGSIIYAYRKNLRIGAVLLSIFLCLHLYANHIQETYYLLYLILAIFIVELIRFYKEKLMAKFMKISAFLLLAGIIGALPIISNLMLTNEYGKFTNRGKSELTQPKIEGADKSELTGLDKNYIRQYSLGFGEIWSLAVPNIKGGANGYLGNLEDKMDKVAPEFKQNVASFDRYWGEQYFTGGAFYFGATICLLFILGMFFIQDMIKWAFFFASALAVMLAWKYSGALDFFIDYVPLFNKFRDTKMMLILAQLSFPLLGMLFLHEMLKKQLDKMKVLYVVTGTLGVFVLFLVLPKVLFGFFSNDELSYFQKQMAQYAQNPEVITQFTSFKEEIEKVRIAIFKEDVIRTIIFTLLTGGLIILYTRNKLAKRILIPAIGILILVDLWMVDKRYLNNEKTNDNYNHWVSVYERSNPFKASPADLQILNWETAKSPELKAKIDQKLSSITASTLPQNAELELEKEKASFGVLNFETSYRVFTLQDPFSNSTISYYHKSIGGYHGAKLKRYQELIDFRLGKEMGILTAAVKTNNDTVLQEALRTQIPTLNMLNTKYIIANPGAAPIRNYYHDGPAWFVNRVKFVASADEEIRALDSINPRRVVVVNDKFKEQLSTEALYDSTASIKLKQYLPNHLTYETSAQAPQIAVFSEIYYKDGWNAYLDGKLVPYVQANYVLRAMNVPAGKHTIEYKFEPKTYYLSKKISTAGSVLIIIFILGVLGFEIFTQIKTKPEVKKE
jgi:hypothetical protein